MTYRVKGLLAFADAADRDAALATIQARLDTAPKLDGTAEAVDALAKPALRLDVRFRTQADADDVEDRLKRRAQQAGVVAARLSWHRCSHDDAVVRSCRRDGAAQLREWAR